MKVVINRCYGGFGLSEAAVRRYFEIKGQPVWVESAKFGLSQYWLVPQEDRLPIMEGADWSAMSIEERQAYNRLYSEQTFYDGRVDRDDPVLVQVVEELGAAASGKYAELAVVEIPDDVRWEIDEYDGMEHIAEQHRTWS